MSQPDDGFVVPSEQRGPVLQVFHVLLVASRQSSPAILMQMLMDTRDTGPRGTADTATYVAGLFEYHFVSETRIPTCC